MFIWIISKITKNILMCIHVYNNSFDGPICSLNNRGVCVCFSLEIRLGIPLDVCFHHTLKWAIHFIKHIFLEFTGRSSSRDLPLWLISCKISTNHWKNDNFNILRHSMPKRYYLIAFSKLICLTAIFSRIYDIYLICIFFSISNMLLLLIHYMQV